jgi:hypothetical protein
MNFVLNYDIKTRRINPIFLTIQKPDCARLSVTGFAALLTPNIFYGTNFKRCENKMILWLTAMHYFD